MLKQKKKKHKARKVSKHTQFLHELLLFHILLGPGYSIKLRTRQQPATLITKIRFIREVRKYIKTAGWKDGVEVYFAFCQWKRALKMNLFQRTTDANGPKFCRATTYVWKEP